jgi:hypothetical protein
MIHTEAVHHPPERDRQRGNVERHDHLADRDGDTTEMKWRLYADNCRLVIGAMRDRLA